jgi:L-arabinose isomerase
MLDISQFEVWFITGSQHLYGSEIFVTIEEHSRKIIAALNESKEIPVKIVFKPILTTEEAIRDTCLEANSDKKCIGIITWMHTFSPAKMWIGGLSILKKPMLHLHTQFNREIPWADIDMDFMNLNQSAHGDREFGFVGSRLRMERKVVVGYWQDPEVHKEIGIWTRAASAWQDSQTGKVARFGDNMRNVAVTEGDKVEAQIKFGYNVHAYGVGDLVQEINAIGDSDIDRLVKEYQETYEMNADLKVGGKKHESLRESARIELGLRKFLTEGNFTAFTTNFENLYGLVQLPGIAAQRLMADGYGFGAEGDWKTAALVRSMKVMSAGMPKGTSFMEDYTYHFGKSEDMILGAHMLEVCSSIASAKPKADILPLSIGNKADPVRLIFESKTGPAVAASIIDMGNRFRLIVNEVDVVSQTKAMPKLPVARALWVPRPNLKIAAQSWILAGGAHHTSFSFDLTTEHLRDFAEMAGVELVVIDKDTQIEEFKKELRWNEVYYQINKFR